MKVIIGKYRSFIGPRQIAEKILFWKDSDDDSVYDLGKKLSNITWLVNLCNWIDSKNTRTAKVRIDNYDTWNMDSTLALIILPMLKQLKEQKRGGPFVSDEDVPDVLKSTSPKANEWSTDDNWFSRWDYVLDEMIFAFESYNNDWEDTFWKVNPEIDFTEYPEDEGQLIKPVRWKVEGECDWEGRKAYQARIQNGFRLFGVYYQALWT